MADNTDAGEKTTATSGEPGATVDSPSTQAVTSNLQDLKDVFRSLASEVSQEEQKKMWATVRQHLGPIQEKMPAIDQLAEAITALTEEGQQTRALVQKLALGTLSEEEVDKVLEESNEKYGRLKAEKASQALAAEVQSLRKQLTDSRPSQQDRKPEEITEWEYQNYYGPMALRMATREGLEFAEHTAKLPKIAAGATHQQWDAWMEKTENYFRQIADARQKAAKSPVDAATPRTSTAAEPRNNREKLVNAWQAELSKPRP